jgi:hypothetical protein
MRVMVIVKASKEYTPELRARDERLRADIERQRTV